MRDELVVSHIPLVKRMARKLSRRLPRHVDRGDLEGAGAVGLVEAARTYQTDRGVAFGAFARRRIYGAMIDVLREADPLSRRERKLATRGGQDWLLIQWNVDLFDPPDPYPLPDTVYETHELRRHLRTAVRHLPQRERYVMSALMVGAEQIQVSRELGVTQSRVCQLRRQAMARLQHTMGALYA